MMRSLQPPPLITARSKGWRFTFGTVALSVLLLGSITVIFFFNPERHGFYPSCLFYKATGLLCPGCGSLRALHQVSHGHFKEAFRLNPLLMLFVPFVVARVIYWFTLGRSDGYVFSQRFIYSGLALLVLFGILRNLPWFRMA